MLRCVCAFAASSLLLAIAFALSAAIWLLGVVTAFLIRLMMRAAMTAAAAAEAARGAS